MSSRPLEALQKYFGYSIFRPGQEAIIADILASRDVLTLMPTGGGKSLCFQIPALLLPEVTLVISPLISLMQDQVDALKSRQISATYLSSTLSENEKNNRLRNIRESKYKLLYVSPERLKSQEFLDAISKRNISLVVIDEAHCISEWGHDFRPEYQEIAAFFTKHKRPPIAAFTATATKKVQEDIIRSLKLKKPRIHRQSFARSNLKISTSLCESQTERNLVLFRLLKKHQGESGIIYTTTRTAAAFVSQLASHINPNFLDRKIGIYHGGLTAQERSTVQATFMSNATPIIAATNAFGMGVDKSDIRFVIHYNLPTSIENYYQEIGRAGRDRKPAACYLLYHHTDLRIHQHFLHSSSNPHAIQEKMKQMIAYAHTKKCQTQFILDYFNESLGEVCKMCSACINSSTEMAIDKHSLLQMLTDDLEAKRLKRILLLKHQLAKQFSLQPERVVTDKVACQLALHQPTNQKQLAQIPGVGQGWMTNWSNRFLSELC